MYCVALFLCSTFSFLFFRIDTSKYWYVENVLSEFKHRKISSLKTYNMKTEIDIYKSNTEYLKPV